MTFKVLTYNIHRGADSAKNYNFEATCAVIKASEADAIGIQEIDRNWSERSNWQDQVEILAKVLGMESVFAVSIDLLPAEAGKPNRQYGNALFSKLPILSSKVHPLYINDNPELVYDGTRETEPRSILQVEIGLGSEKISILCTHLSVHSQQERLKQVGKLEGIIRTVKGPLILMGDLNADSDSEELSRLRKLLVDPSFGKGLITKPDEARQIDYILLRDFEASQVQTIRSDASDHLPIRAKISF